MSPISHSELNLMKAFFSIAAALSIGLLTMNAHANGEATYQAVCASCHASGANNAPRVGDQRKWAVLIREGQARITADGYVGVRAMPARGGKPDLSIEEFASAVVYMANQSGGRWSAPDAQLLAAIQREIDKREKSLALKTKK
ncbi:MAG: cytochrome c5 family protein [Burkholderiaceae bacterium]|nr:cytochrome c5 family protein [Burkholderiaceae bacterium]